MFEHIPEARLASRLIVIVLSVKYNTAMDTKTMAQALGRRGGRARARRLSSSEKARIASLGGAARRHSLEAARRIEQNFRYVAAVEALRGGRPRVVRIRSFDGPLPGIYPGTS